MFASAVLQALQDDPVTVTGMGAVGAGQSSADGLWKQVLSGESNACWIRPDSLPDHRFPACRMDNEQVVAGLPRDLRKMDRSVHLASRAAREAWADAGLPDSPVSPDRIGIFCGTSRGPVNKWGQAHEQLNRRNFFPTLAAAGTIASLSGSLAQEFRVTGPAYTLSAACASAAFAIIAAAKELILGTIDVALAGGTESPLEPTVMRCLQAAGVLAEGEDPRTMCRPFSEARNGLILGEGSGFLVLERASHARKRDIPIQSILKGWATATDMAGRVGITEDGKPLSKLIGRTMDMAELSPGQIGWVNAHGTGTWINDRAESNALLDSGMAEVPVSSTKPITGHCVGATPALEAILSIRAIQDEVIPHTRNTTSPAEDCPINLVTGSSRPLGAPNVLSLSSGFWGSQTALIFSRT